VILNSGADTGLIDLVGDAELRADPHIAFDRLREAEPVHWSEQGNLWLISLHEDAVRLLKDRARVGADIRRIRGYAEQRPLGAGSSVETMLEGALISKDAPDHTRLRRASNPRFVRPYVERELTATVERVVDELLEGLPTDSEVDFIGRFAVPLPMNVICGLLGVPVEDGVRLNEWAVDQSHAIEPIPTEAHLELAETATRELYAYLADRVSEREDDRGDDLIGTLLDARDAGHLTHAELLDRLLEVVVAGTETTTTLVPGALEALARHPDQWDRLKADPELVPAAVEEFLRYTTPATFGARVALEDFELRGRQIAAGENVQIVLPAANRDPRAFAAPAEVDVGRAPNPHVAFGGGEHICLGAHLARLEARIAFREMVRRWGRAHVALDRVRRRDRIGVWSYAEFPVTVEA
jgi:pimeloyl-[acyl-carrier protein] synthase